MLQQEQGGGGGGGGGGERGRESESKKGLPWHFLKGLGLCYEHFAFPCWASELFLMHISSFQLFVLCMLCIMAALPMY